MSTKCCAALLSSVSGLALTGCTLIGFGIGAAADASKKPVVVPGTLVAAIEKGASVRVVLMDGRRIKGKYLGLVPTEGSGPEGPIAILVDTGSGSAPPIPVASVVEVRVSRRARGKWIGAGVGAALDITALILVSNFEYP